MKKSTILTLAALALVLVVVLGLMFERGRRQDAASPRSVLVAEDAPGGTGDVVPLSQAQSVPRPAASAKDREKVRILEQIFHARNDNDPRLDLEFRDLTPAAKELLRDKYRSLASESRNERGTIVFLLGRNLRAPSDFEFMGEVVKEAPCRSLADCTKAAPDTKGADAHEEVGTEVTLAYPQIIALEMMKPFAKERSGAQVLEEATHSPNPAVADRARRILAASPKS